MSVRLQICSGTLMLWLAGSLAASASNLDTLVQQLAGNDEVARAGARQLLPREGVAAVSELLPLLAHPDANVWCAAYNTLADIASEVSAPGRERDRAAVAKDFMTLLAPEQPTEIKIRGLRLVPLVLPEGCDVGPVAALLNDPDLKDKARAALQESGTGKACRALATALRNADPDFQCALLNSLGQLHDKRSFPSVLRHTKSREPKVRAAAARALSWTGDPGYTKVARAVYSAATPETAFDAADAMIRLADALAIRHGDSAAATALYREVLASSTVLACRDAALVGLVRHGHETATNTVIAALRGDQGREFEPVLLSACENAKGSSVNNVLLAAYRDLSGDVRPALLGAMGRKHDAVFLDLLGAASRDGDPALRRAAVTAMADSQLPGAVPALVSAANTTNAEDKAAAISELTRLAGELGAGDESRAAGKAYLSLYSVADSPETRQTALEGMTRFPTTESSAILIKAIDSGEIKDAPAAMLAGLAKGLRDTGHAVEADHAVGLLLNRARSPESINEVIQAAHQTGGVPNLAQRLGFVTAWQLAGPFPWSESAAFSVKHVNEPNVDTKAVYQVSGKPIAWKAFGTQDETGMVNLTTALGTQSDAIGYGIATISLAAAADAVARMGSDDGVKLWVNGAAVHENNINRGTQIDQDLAPVKLKAGVNTLLIAITQGGGGWNFCLRLTTPDGAPLSFTQGP